MFEVEEEHVRAVTTEDNGPVWEDSCVEFFVADPVGDGYFNFEINCIGTALAAHRYSRSDARHFDEGRMSRIRRITSLPPRSMCGARASVGGSWRSYPSNCWVWGRLRGGSRPTSTSAVTSARNLTS